MVCVLKIPHSHLLHKLYAYIDKNKLKPDFQAWSLKDNAWLCGQSYSVVPLQLLLV